MSLIEGSKLRDISKIFEIYRFLRNVFVNWALYLIHTIENFSISGQRPVFFGY